MGSRVRVLSVTHVRPSETSNPLTDNDDHAIKFSLFDTMFLPYQPMQQLFFYEGDDLPPVPALLGTLQSSLPATLAIFTPLAGNLAVSKSGDVVIDCSPGAVSQGVRFVEAEYAGSTDDMRRLASDAEHDAEAYTQLVPTVVVSALPVPALAVQVTRPADTDDGGGTGAVVVGVSMCHGVGDGQALWEFIRAWAAWRGTARRPCRDSCRRLKNGHRIIRVAITSSSEQVNAFPKPDTTLQGRRTYLLSASQIRSLKQRISPQSNGNLADGERAPPAAVAKPPTTYAAVASLVWTSGVRAKNALSRTDDDAYLLFAADCRARLRPPMPAAFFGNCVKLCYARTTRYQAVPPDRFVQIGSSNRFAAYEIDFGWGKPSRVELAAVFVREFVAVVGAADGAVQVSVVLDRGRMDGFEANFLSQLDGLE
ncbi:unnamed protein product [Miscanthus lutarioriparius]|uniref:Uncharacterized protein n=1 Tax=Miscanthus lutarioriparius TaxID=422564 RepID=A0A811SK09_9POAL|nr:unnamed protein product [Miscanthus lutarioriparius]